MDPSLLKKRDKQQPNTSQFLPRVSNELHDNFEQFTALNKIFAHVFRWLEKRVSV
jgi:hypothetical protein